MVDWLVSSRLVCRGQVFFALLVFATLIGMPSLASAALQAQLDRSSVVLDETFTLTLQSDEGGGEPDLSPLKQDFEVIGTGQSSSFQIHNTEIKRSKQWLISLRAKRVGNLSIPSIKVGNQATPIIALTVIPADQAPASQARGNIFLEVSAEPRAVYVQQQFIYTTRLFRAVNLGDRNALNEPAFPGMDASVQRLGEDRNFELERNGQNYFVIERRFLVTPQKSGNFASDPVTFEGSIIEPASGGSFIDPFRQRAKAVRLRSQSIDIEVKPIPAHIAADKWLPASTLRLSEEWAPSNPVFKVGEPITRTISIQASGANASQLPTVEIDGGDKLKIYPDQAVLKDSPGDAGVTGLRQQKFAIIPSSEGSYTLPAVSVHWWNTKTGQEEVATLPERQITIGPAVAGSQIDAMTAPPVLAANEAATGSSAFTVLGTSALRANGWPWLALALGIAWIITLIAWWRARRSSPAPVAAAFQANPQSAGERQLLNQIKVSCINNDAASATTQLLAWAKHHWLIDPPTSLSAMARQCDAELGDALTQLEQHRYAASASTWQGAALWQALQAFQSKGVAASATPDVFLQPLFKSGTR